MIYFFALENAWEKKCEEFSYFFIFLLRKEFCRFFKILFCFLLRFPRCFLFYEVIDLLCKSTTRWKIQTLISLNMNFATIFFTNATFFSHNHEFWKIFENTLFRSSLLLIFLLFYCQYICTRTNLLTLRSLVSFGKK